MSDYTDEDVTVAEAAVEALYDDGQPHEHAEEIAAVLDAVVPAIVRRAKAEALRDAAERTIAETVCCDEWERRRTEPRPKHPHHICFWGGAHAEALRERADEIEGQS